MTQNKPLSPAPVDAEDVMAVMHAVMLSLRGPGATTVQEMEGRSALADCLYPTAVDPALGGPEAALKEFADRCQEHFDPAVRDWHASVLRLAHRFTGN